MRLEMSELTKIHYIVGGGVIGIEWASMLTDFGVEVTVLRYVIKFYQLKMMIFPKK